MTFILNARYFLVTYPQSDGLDEWAVNDHFGSLGAECIVARENHATRGTHLHVFCDFGRKFRSRRADIFDVGGFHPNIERSKRNPRKGAEYACKDGDVVAGGLDVPSLATRLIPAAQDPGSTLVCAENQREFFDIAEDICPWDLITKFGSFHAYAKWRWPEVGEPYENPAGFSIADGAFPELVSWRNGALEHGGGRIKSLVLIGEALTGKTTWARMLGNHLYMKERYNAKQASLADGVDYGIIDDISGGIKFFPHWKSWFGGQPHIQVKILYRDERLVKWGKPLIWIANRDPRDQLRDMISRDYSEEQCNNDIYWMEGNAIFVDIGANSIISRANID